MCLYSYGPMYLRTGQDVQSMIAVAGLVTRKKFRSAALVREIVVEGKAQP